MLRLRWLTCLLFLTAPGWAAAPLAIEAEVQDGWPLLDGPGGPSGAILPGQMRRVEVVLHNPGPNIVVLQSVEPGEGLTGWFEAPFGTVTRRGAEATLDRSTRTHTHGGSMLTMAVWPEESLRITVAARITGPVLRLTANFHAVDVNVLAQQFYVEDADHEPGLYHRRAPGWLAEHRPIGGLWFHHDLDIEQGWPILATGERAEVPQPKYPQQKLVAEFQVGLADRPAGVAAETWYSNALGGYVELREGRRAQLIADPRPMRLAHLSPEALNVLDAAPGPYAIRIAPAGSAPPAGLPDGVALLDEDGWQAVIVPEQNLAAMLSWVGGAGLGLVVRDAFFDERPIYALP